MLKTFLILCLLGNYARQDSLIKSYLQTGKIAEVEKLFAQGESASGGLTSHTTEDTFLLAEFAYFTCKFEQALELYKKIPPARLECNNALEKIIIIQDCGASDLQNYVQAELLGRQGKWEQGIELLKKLKQSDSPIASYSLILLMQFFDITEQFENSIKACQEFIMKYPESSKIPEILLKEAEIYTKNGKQAEAKRIYKEILLKYPKSTIASIARIRLE